jgi:lysophospholipase L1-like esterase
MNWRYRHLVAALTVVCPFATVTPARSDDGRPLRIVAFGDSTTAVRGEVEQVYAQRLPKKLAAHGIEVEVINAGVGGHTTTQARERFRNDVLRHKPDLVIIQFGLNDSVVELPKGDTTSRVAQAEYERNLDYFVKTLKARGSQVILMTQNALRWTDKLRADYGKPPYDPDDRWGLNALNAKYAESVRKTARAHDVALVDVYQLFLDYDRVPGQSADALLTDGVHPGDEAHRLIADLLTEQIAKIVNPDRLDAHMPRGYSIPLIDLAEQKHRQVIVDREPGQYLGHPTTVLLEDNQTMICVYPKGHGKGAVVMKRSTDAGLTWSERLPTPKNWETSQEVPTLHRVSDPKTGKKRLIMFSGLYPIRMAVSEDDGRNWTPLEPIGDFGGIVTMGCVAHLQNGGYVAMFHDDGRFFRKDGKRTKTFTLYQIFSRDGGLTWNKPEAIWTGSDMHLCEPGIIRSPNGKQLAILLRENSRTRNSHVMFSNDEAKTWSKPRELPGALTGDRHTGKYAPDGRLFISFRDTTHESPTQGDWVAWVGTYDDIVHGREGQYRVRLMDNHHRWDCAYPGVEVLPDGTFVTTTYGHWIDGEKPFIVSVRLKLDELDQAVGTLPTPEARKPAP